MTISLTQQATVFLVSLVTGVLCGAAFDFLRSLRAVIQCRTWSITAADVMFWLFCAAMLFTAGIYYNSGEIRYYQVVGAVLGAAFYFLTISAPLLRALIWLETQLLTPVRRIIHWVKHCCGTISTFILKCVKTVKHKAELLRLRRKNVRKKLKML